MTNIEFSTVIIILTGVNIFLAIFHLRRKTVERKDPGRYSLWKPLLFFSSLGFIAGISLLLLPPEIWWPAR